VSDVHHASIAMLAAESSPFARHAKVGLLSAQLARLAYDIHHASIAMVAAKSSPFARHAKGGLRSAQLARLAYDINHASIAMGAAESSPFARRAKGGLRRRVESVEKNPRSLHDHQALSEHAFASSR
jgi:outer membrane murein-binding lipoprotein Lpp